MPATTTNFFALLQSPVETYTSLGSFSSLLSRISSPPLPCWLCFWSNTHGVPFGSNPVKHGASQSPYESLAEHGATLKPRLATTDLLVELLADGVNTRLVLHQLLPYLAFVVAPNDVATSHRRYARSLLATCVSVLAVSPFLGHARFQAS